MPGVDPNLAFMGVVVVATAGLGFCVHTTRGILERLLAVQRAADRAQAEAMLYRTEQGYQGTLADYRDLLGEYERLTKPRPVAPVRKKKAPAPPRPKPKISDLETVEHSFDPLEPRIDWKAPARG